MSRVLGNQRMLATASGSGRNWTYYTTGFNRLLYRWATEPYRWSLHGTSKPEWRIRESNPTGILGASEAITPGNPIPHSVVDLRLNCQSLTSGAKRFPAQVHQSLDYWIGSSDKATSEHCSTRSGWSPAWISPWQLLQTRIHFLTSSLSLDREDARFILPNPNFFVLGSIWWKWSDPIYLLYPHRIQLPPSSNIRISFFLTLWVWTCSVLHLEHRQPELSVLFWCETNPCFWHFLTCFKSRLSGSNWRICFCRALPCLSVKTTGCRW